MLGFKISEDMIGTHIFETGWGPEGEHEFRFTGHWGPLSIKEWLNPFGDLFLKQLMFGEITVGGLGEHIPFSGSLELNYFSEAKIKYTIDFEYDGTYYTYVGEKVNIKPWNILTSHTTCFGTLVDTLTGELVSKSVVHFRFRDLFKFLFSVRFKGD